MVISWQLAKGSWQGFYLPIANFVLRSPGEGGLLTANLLFDTNLRHSFLIKNDLTHILR